MLDNIHKQYTFSINLGDDDILHCTKFYDTLEAAFADFQSFITSKEFSEEWHLKLINEIIITTKTFLTN